MEGYEIAIIVCIIFIFILILFYPKIKTYLSNRIAIVNAKKTKAIPKKNERRVREILEEHFKKPFPSVRPDFLRYPLTGKNLEIDCYNAELKIGVEYNGIQHYKFTPRFHKSEEDLKSQMKRDAYKNSTCKLYGIKLYTVPYTVKYENLKDYVLDLVK